MESNHLPSGYEPPALTDELHPRAACAVNRLKYSRKAAEDCIIFRLMFENIKTFIKNPKIEQLKDVRTVGLIIFGVVAVLVSWSTISAIQTNYGLQKQITAVKQQNDVLELQNKNQELANQYYGTNAYLELAARRQLGKAAPGETVLLVPKSVALAHTVDLPAVNKGQAAISAAHKSVIQRNFQAWMDFFQHRLVED